MQGEGEDGGRVRGGGSVKEILGKEAGIYERKKKAVGLSETHGKMAGCFEVCCFSNFTARHDLNFKVLKLFEIKV